MDWTTGNYTVITRSGRVETAERWGDLKQPTRMIAEGSVLLAPHPPRGGVRNVAPASLSHPVYRAGYAVSIPIPWKAPV